MATKRHGGKRKGSHRKAIEKRYDALYETRKPYGDRCVYCGDIANTLDHVPALNSVYGVGTDWYYRKGIELVKYPACRECNTALNDKMLDTVAERQRWIERYLDRRYEALITLPKWDEEDLDELGEGLRGMVVNSQGVRSWLLRRLDWARTRPPV